MTSSRADLHCHSTASQESRLGVQRALGLPECATPPEEVYALAKRRGMDFVTITDHDTIDGVVQIADRPDVFVSEELTAWFRGEPQAVHVLCLGITPGDHEWLQAHAADVEVVASYLREHEIACALAHPFYAVAAPLQARHRRRLARLFDVWEVRNGARAPELNQPAAVYVDTHGGGGVGGSDDHAGVDIGRTWTATPSCATPAEFLAHVREGRGSAEGEQGWAAKWAHAAMALAVRALGCGGDAPAPDPAAVLRMVERVMTEGDARSGPMGSDLCPEDARALLHAWLDAVDLRLSERDLLALLQSDGFSHADLERRARRRHERRLRSAVGALDAAQVFEACCAAIPYAPAAAFLAREQGRLAPGDGRRVALVADGIGSMHGVTHTLDEIRERGVPGFEVDVVGTDSAVDRRLSAAAELEVPFYRGMTVGVPSLPAVVEALTAGRYGLVHVCAPGPAGVAALLVARMLGEGEALARAYADADVFLFCSQTDTFGQVVLEAQASGLPVVAVGAGGPAELIEDGRSGVLCRASTGELAAAVAGLAAAPRSRERLARGGLAAVRGRTWEASLAALAAGWQAALAFSPARPGVAQTA
jgi:predicted metal-dependent phosphoesterase TrpH